MTDRTDARSHAGSGPVALLALPGAGGVDLARAMEAAAVPVLRGGSNGSGAPQFESYADRILAACQASWSAPPDYRPGWNAEPEVVDLVRRQLRLLTGDAAEQGRVWFEEHHQLLFDLWLQEGQRFSGAVLLWDTPELAVYDLKSQGIRPSHAVALWELAAQRSLASLAGSRVFVCSRTQLADEESTTRSALSGFLATCGVAGDGAMELSLHAPAPHAVMDRTEEQARMIDFLTTKSGPNDALTSVQAVSLSTVAEELLQVHLALYRSAVDARTAWLKSGHWEREAARVQAELDQTMAGVDALTDSLLSAMGVPAAPSRERGSP